MTKIKTLVLFLTLMVASVYGQQINGITGTYISPQGVTSPCGTGMHTECDFFLAVGTDWSGSSGAVYYTYGTKAGLGNVNPANWLQWQSLSVVGINGAQNVFFHAGSNTIATTYGLDGLRGGDVVKVSGTVNNNGIKHIISTTGTDSCPTGTTPDCGIMTVSESLVDENPGNNGVVIQKNSTAFGCIKCCNCWRWFYYSSSW